MLTEYRINQLDFEHYPGKWFIQGKGILGKWKFLCGYYETEKFANEVFELIKAGEKKIFVGKTDHCVYCGKQLPDNYIGCGSVLMHNMIVTAHFCNDLCLRNIYLKMPGWDKSNWLYSYGIKFFDEPFI